MTFINKLKGYQIIFEQQAKKDLKKINKPDAHAIKNKLTAIVAGDQNVDVKRIVAAKI